MSRTLPLLSFLKRGRSRLSNGSACTGLDRTLNFLFSAGIGFRRFQRQRASILRPRGVVKISLADPDRAERRSPTRRFRRWIGQCCRTGGRRSGGGGVKKMRPDRGGAVGLSAYREDESE